MFRHEPLPQCFAWYFVFLPTNVQACVQRYIQTILFTRIGCTPVFMVRILSVITFRYIYECLPDTERSAAAPQSPLGAGPPNRFDKVTPLSPLPSALLNFVVPTALYRLAHPLPRNTQHIRSTRNSAFTDAQTRLAHSAHRWQQNRQKFLSDRLQIDARMNMIYNDILVRESPACWCEYTFVEKRGVRCGSRPLTDRRTLGIGANMIITHAMGLNLSYITQIT